MFARVPFRQPALSPLISAGPFRPPFNPSAAKTVISDNFADLSRIYQDGVNLCLIERREAGLRLSTLDKAMCPHFHVDRAPARMICSYGGIGTEWLPEYAADRSKLGMGACGLPDGQSGLIADPSAIRQMPAYAVGLMKGENWEGNEGGGLVHRSPQPTAVHPRRLLLTLDLL